MKLIRRRRLVHLLVRVVLGAVAGVQLIGLVSMPANADPIPGYCVGFKEPPVGATVCTP